MPPSCTAAKRHAPPEKSADLGGWRAHGMRASATGTVDFEGIAVTGDEILGTTSISGDEPGSRLTVTRARVTKPAPEAKVFTP
jgi:alkylation response protein AidB-like acyl-CoA dehydrogenase